jgi:Tfp pilus assembly protein PilV
MMKAPRSEEGFGLVELLIAMTVLNVGLLAIVAAFSSSAIAINRAGRVGSAAALADTQTELYRTVTYDAIGLDLAATTDATYKGDTVACANGTDCSNIAATSPTCPNANFPNACTPTRVARGADDHNYRVDTYIKKVTVSGQRDTKQVTIVVRDEEDLTLRPLARVVSVFDCSSGQVPNTPPC